ncbi:MAG TPA: glycoside hydrolase family 99-like domain-containing protein [Bauldia sp.]|nr:glycoside hydrolase family 99-like domain-containing protein [Bauldia sp.]
MVTLPAPAGKNVCLYAAYSPDCRVRPYVQFQLRALKESGFATFLVLSAPKIPNANLRRQAEGCEGFVVRQGGPGSFDAWGEVLRAFPRLAAAESILLSDDSAFGPVSGLSETLVKARGSVAGDIVGIAENYATGRRFDTCFILLKKRALHSDRLLAAFAARQRREHTALAGDDERGVEFLSACQNAGLRCEALLPSPPSLAERTWTELLDAGSPYLPYEAALSASDEMLLARIPNDALREVIRQEKQARGLGGEATAPAGPAAPAVAFETNAAIKPVTSSDFATVYRAYLGSARGGRDPTEYEEKNARATSAGACDVNLIAYYLPQFHPTPENNEWWGKGFTEWTNVSKAVPLFVGHYQPRLPGEFGYYDLRIPDIMQRQAELARHYGVTAFCFHTYWFNGRRLLEAPLLDLLQKPDVDIKFCLCWANENWTRRWDGAEQQLLLAQRHSPEDDVAFIRYLAKYFDDPRYLRIQGKPVLTVYLPGLLPNPAATADRWREEAHRLGLPGLYLVATNARGFAAFRQIGFDALSEFPPHAIPARSMNANVRMLVENFGGQIFRYEDAIRAAQIKLSAKAGHWPGVMPAWDNTARRLLGATVFQQSTPALYEAWLKMAIAAARGNPPGERFVLINAWNEWAEGAYLEPDRRFGYAYLNASARALRASGYQGAQTRNAANAHV